MTSLELRKKISSLCTHMLFEYKGHSCGVDPLAPDDFDMWCDENYMKASSIDEVMSTPFFRGRKLQDIADEIENVE